MATEAQVLAQRIVEAWNEKVEEIIAEAKAGGYEPQVWYMTADDLPADVAAAADGHLFQDAGVENYYGDVAVVIADDGSVAAIAEGGSAFEVVTKDYDWYGAERKVVPGWWPEVEAFVAAHGASA